ncbi:hypothetical protein WJX77_005025 [Trebouxia sp. C0004]
MTAPDSKSSVASTSGHSDNTQAYRDSSPGRSSSPLKTTVHETAPPSGGEAGAAEIPKEIDHSAEAYLMLLQQYQSNTAPKAFVYLRRTAANPADYNPYILRVVSFAKADKGELYTLSAKGVNQYRDNVHTEFTALEQWQQEVSLFGSLKRLRTFHQYKLWKGFRQAYTEWSWRDNVCQTKTTRARVALQHNLFMANLVLQEHLVSVWGFCSKLTGARLQQLLPGQVLRLPEFLASQETKHDQSVVALSAFSDMVQDSHVQHSELQHTAGHGKHALAQQQLIMQHPDSAQEFKYTLRAARRTELRRLRSFVKMADYMMCDTLQQVLSASVMDILQAGIHEKQEAGAAAPASSVSEEAAVISNEGSDQPSLESDAAAASSPESTTDEAASQSARSCIFEVEVVLTITGTKITPSISHFLRALEALLADWMSVLSGLRRLWEADEVTSLIASPGQENPPHTPLAALVDAGDLQGLVAQLTQSWQAAFAQVEDFRQSYTPFEDMLRRNDSVNVPAMAAAYVESFSGQLLPASQAVTKSALTTGDAGQQNSTPAIAAIEPQHAGATISLKTFKGLMDDLRRQLKDIHNLSDKNDVGMFRVDAQQLKTALLPSPTALLAQLGQRLPRAAAQLYTAFIDQVHSATSMLKASISSVEEYVQQLAFLETLKANQSKVDEYYNQVQAAFELVLEYGMTVPAMDMAAYHTLTADMNALQQAAEGVEAHQEERTEAFGRELGNGAQSIIKQVAEMRTAAQAEMVLDENSEAEVVISYLSDLLQQAQTQQTEQERIVYHQSFLNFPKMVNDDLALAQEEIELRLLVWTSSTGWAEASQTWAETAFSQLDMLALEESIAAFAKRLLRMERGLPSNQVVKGLGESVKVMQGNLPTLQALRNPALRERHWTKLAAIMTTPLVTDPPLTLAQLLDLKVVSQQEAVVTLSVEASQEAALEDLLDHISSKWNSIDFSLIPFKDVKDAYILGSVEDVTAALEDSMVTMSTILASRFMVGIRNEVERVDRQLHLFSDTLDEWLACQKDWMYLKTIFTAPDIQRQLPHEAKAFASVDKQFKEVMRRTRERTNAMQAATTPGLLEAFQKSNEVLETISKSLEDYLETKRMAFPRFYFLSNDELLDILAQSKSPQAVQPHLGKCFDGIRRLEFGGDDPKSPDILAMVSAEGEKVPLGKNLKARGNVEAWLSQVEQSMAVCLRKLARAGHQSYPSQARTQWVTQQPSQLVLLISQIYWCSGVEQCLAAPSPSAALAQYLLTCTAQLGALTRLVRGSLPDLHRRTLAALITIDVHARDIVDNLIREGVQDASEFAWQMQLRYSWNDAVDDVVMRQVNARFIYGYEYVGAQGRLVITPMTDRCYITLTAALHHKLGASPAGPAGTGKTETTKDLGKALGVNCVVFNCGERLDYRFMGKFFAGLAQSGAWACFDEFNRIDIEVLSVVAQQLLTIQNALRAELPKFNFEGRTIGLIPTCGVFITMNPGYAGRSDLPDNLKALFRPVAMMIPDYALVAEVMLLSEGFEDSRTLACKMVKLYKLASEQLSQQDHYDFGMRAVKSVLVMAGSLRRSQPNLAEDVMLIRAMRDSNLPKFLSADIELFQNIISDLFPGVEVPFQAHGELEAATCAVLEKQGLQKPAAFVHKILQLHETLGVRFGAMLVGQAGTGKSTLLRTLQGAMDYLHEQNGDSEVFQPVLSYTLNPKCVSMGELYGEYNALTSEWKDGLASTLIRSAVTDATPVRKWVVFDGPVDAMWIENMNTVLDDNCTLCLPNGERLKLNPVSMRMLFEVADLSVASPATVSRCGMVYVPPDHLGWRPFVQTWAQQGLLGAVSEASRTYLLALFEQHVDPCLAWLRAQGSEYLPSVDIALVTGLATLLQSLLAPDHGVDLAQPQDQLEPILSQLFAFAYIWGLGGSLTHESHQPFSAFVRTQLAIQVQLPPTGSVFDFFVDVKKGPQGVVADMQQWGAVLPAFAYDKHMPYFQMLVPTVDTVRYSFLLKACLEVQKAVLFTGTTGVGKSVIVSGALERLRGTKTVVPYTVNFSAQTQAMDTQLFMESKLEKKRKTRYGAPVGQKLVFFVDDVNMPAREVFGSQPPVELLRQFLDYKGFYDRSKLFWKDVDDTTLVAACAPPGGGRQPLSSRFVRHFSQLCIPPPSDAAIKTILTTILGGFLADWPADLRALCAPIVASAVEAYNRVSAELLPTPAKSHYTFNLRDLSKVAQGMLMVSQKQCSSKQALVRLWLHESMRVFHDRLIDDQDKGHFRNILRELVGKNLCSAVGSPQELFPEGSSIIFGGFLKPGLDAQDRPYEEIVDQSKLIQTLERFLEDYNSSSSKPMGLVFFQDAVDHIASIARVLRQPRGNALLVGVSGSGKQSLTRFAAALGGCACHQLELTKAYGLTEFREDLKKLYHVAGVEGKPVVFLLTDTQISKESFLEDVNNLLNSGEVPGMYAPEDKEGIIGSIREWLLTQGAPTTKEACWSAFINRVRDNLHCVLAMSPVGGAFRARCRMFPSLINCCTIDWFRPWPDQALLSVSTQILAPCDLAQSHIKPALASMCVHIHTSVAVASDKMYAQLRRRYYTSPKSYMDLISLYTSLLAEKSGEYGEVRDRLSNGLNKLQDTNAMVDSMQAHLNQLQPILEEKAQATATLLEQVTVDQKQAESVRATVSKEESQVKAKAAETQALADEAKADLDQALPALNAALDSLNALNKGDIVEIKSMLKPPPLVQMTMEAVCTLKEEKADWDTAKRVLGDSGFMRSLLEFDKDHIPDGVVKKLRKYTDSPEFTPEAVAKQSKAAQSLCMWCRAMEVYDRIVKVVEPKRVALRGAEALLIAANAQLQEKQAALKAVEQKVAGLEAALSAAEGEQASLKEQASVTATRLQRAAKLTSGLQEEGVRWGNSAQQIKATIQLLIGDVLLSAACIAYYGAFPGDYRQELVSGWVEKCKEFGIPVSPDCTLRGVLASPIQVRDWRLWGLPADDVSVDNGILVSKGKRWPLMIDPQGQANAWVRNMEGRAGLKLVKLSQPNFLRLIEGAVRLGQPVLIEEVGEAIDPALEPLLLKQVFKQGGQSLIHLGDSDVEYHPGFQLYMTTPLANPHYLPEVCIKVTLVNFTVTGPGLEEQLLAELVRKERPDLQASKDRLLLSISNDKRQLKELEDKILNLLKEAKGNILDDEVLINTLNNSKLTAGMIQNRLREAEETEDSINQAREQYRSAAAGASTFYFVVADLALISPMYQTSLSYFITMFNHCIDASDKAPDVSARLRLLTTFATRFIFDKVQRGLFEQHKLLFSFMLATATARAAGQVTQAEWNFFLRGGPGLDSAVSDRASPSWLPSSQWGQIMQLAGAVCPLEGVADSMCLPEESIDWQEWAASSQPHLQSLPPVWEHTCTSFHRLLLLKVMREDKLLLGCQRYIGDTLGAAFTQGQPWTLDGMLLDTTALTPIIFILTSGADPTAMLQRFGEKQGMKPGERLHMVSLGQGQGPVAETLVALATAEGDWVCLQNCHLAKSWMPRLASIVEELAKSKVRQEEGDGGVHPDFRLWLSSMPSPDFPASVLRSGIKLTSEPPKGVKANVTRTYADMTAEPFQSSCPSKPTAWKKLLFSLTFFHAVIQERRKFGSIGWNIPYSFNQSDLECSMMGLASFLNEAEEQVPWPAMEYVLGQINYGGHVTDDMDRRCLMSTLRRFITPRVMDKDYCFTPVSGTYYPPPAGSLEQCRQFIKALPAIETPEVFGMHENANIAFELQETHRVLDTILAMQPRLATLPGSTTPDQQVAAIAASILDKLPPILSMAEAGPGVFERTSAGQLNSLAVVLGQEMERFNRLSQVMSSSLEELQKALQGLVVMSGELELMSTSLLNSQVPDLWKRVAYPSLKPLGSWVADYHQRIAFMRSWLRQGLPKSFWLPGFFFPQGLMTGVLQTYARKYGIAIDSLSFAFQVSQLKEPAEIVDAPEDGILINGLWLEGAQWQNGCLTESSPDVMYSPLPVIHFTPVQDYVAPDTGYDCPLYKTSARAGALSTTGQSTNFVLCVSLPIREGTDRDHWILQGVALLCMLNN